MEHTAGKLIKISDMDGNTLHDLNRKKGSKYHVIAFYLWNPSKIY